MPECENCGHCSEKEVNFCLKCGSPSTQQSVPNIDLESPALDIEYPPQTAPLKNECPICGQENPQENNFCNN